MNIDELNIKISSNSTKAKNGIDKVKTALTELGAVDTSNLAKLLEELDALGVAFKNVGKGSSTDATDKQSTGAKKLKVSVENATPKITELRKELALLSEQGLSFGDEKFDKTYAELAKAKESLKSYKKTLNDSTKTEKSQSKLDEETEKAKRLDEIIQRVVDKEKELEAKANKTFNEVASYGKDKVKTSYKDTPSAKGSTLGGYFANDPALKELRSELSMVGDKYKEAFENGTVHRSAQDWANFSSKVKETGSATESAMTKSKDSVAKFDSKIVTTNADIEKTKQELAQLSSRGLSFGDSKFDATYSKLVRLQGELKEYKNTLGGTFKFSDFTAGLRKGLSKVGTVLKSLTKLSTKFAKTLIKGTRNALTQGIRPLSEGLKRAKNMFKNMLTRSILYSAMSAIREGFGQLAKEDKRFNASMSRMYSSLMQLKYGFVSAFAPIIEAVEPIITRFLNMCNEVVQKVTEVFSALTGGKTVTVATKQTLDFADAMDESSKSTDKATKANKKYVAGFDELNITTDNKSSDSDSTDDAYKTVYTTSGANEIAEAIKRAWENFDFTEIGSKIAEKIVSSLKSINWDNIQKKAFGAGKSFATLINGLLEYTDKDGDSFASTLGSTLGNAVQTALDYLGGFVKNLHWGSVGDAIKDAVTGFVKKINWKKNFEHALEAGKGLSELLVHAFATKDKYGKTTLSNITEFIANIVNAINKFIKGAIDELDKEIDGVSGWEKLGQSLGEALADGILAVDWDLALSNVKGVGKGIYDFMHGLFGVFFGGINEATGHTYAQDLWNEIGKQICAGILAGMVSVLALPFLKGANSSNDFNTIFTSVYDGLCNAFGIESPAKKMYPIGKYIFLGILEGIKEEIKTGISTWFKTHVVDKFQTALDNLGALKVKFTEKISESLTKWRTWFDSKKNESKELKANFKKSIAEKLQNWRDWFSSKLNNAKTLTSNFAKSLGSGMQTWKDWFSNASNNSKSLTAKFGCTISNALDSFVKTWNGLKDKVVNLTYNITQKLNGVLNNDPNLTNKGGGLFSGISNWFKGLFHADGGFPESNDIFFANENGIPEFIGRMGRRTAVANNEQITDGIANAVFDAIISAGGLFGNQNQQTKAVANINLKVSEDTIAKAMYDYQTKQLRQGGTMPSYV